MTRKSFVKGKTSVYSWGLFGWCKKEVQDEDITQLNCIKNRNYEQPEFSFRGGHDDVALIRQIQEGIQTGSAFDAIDKLPGMLRILLESSECWHISSENLYKVVDPITQAKCYGEWGNDLSEADNPSKSHARAYLEAVGIAPVLDNSDVMGDVIEAHDAETHIVKNCRTDLSIDWISEDEEEGENSQEDSFTPVVIELEGETKKLYEEAHQRYINRLITSNNSREREIALLLFEQELDASPEFNAQLTLRMDSPFFVDGYQQPRRRHEFIYIEQESPVSIAAQAREKLFFDLFAEASFCRSKEDLYGPVDTFGMHGSSKGFYAQIRQMYKHDRELNAEWSIEDRTDKNGEVIKSAFNKARENFIISWRKDNTGDEESLRQALWFMFDRVQEEVPAEYEDGRLVSSHRSYKDSNWRQKRTQAMTELNLTVAQWNAIYTLCDLINKRIEMNGKKDKEEEETIKQLREQFNKIETLDDLSLYRRWAEKRRWIYKKVILKEWRDRKGVQRTSYKKVNTYKFIPSRLDKLSMSNTSKWWKSILRKERELQLKEKVK